MNIFDILGPVMVGPSSSHTAGAVRIGFVSRTLLGEEPVKARILLAGSFADTGKGHGTDKAIIAGLLGMDTDDINIPDVFDIAQKQNFKYEFGTIQLPQAHPNTAVINLWGKSGKELNIQASSLGGGRIMVDKIDGIDVNFTGEYPTLIVHNQDQPGHVAEVTSMLSHKSVNIANMQLNRDKKGGYAVMVLETDQPIPSEAISWLAHLEGIIKVTYYNPTEVK